MSEYKKVNILEYVKEGLKKGTLVPRKAEKFARIAARPGVEGEKVTSWSVDQDGNPIVEKVAYVSLDEKTKKPGWVATKLGDDLQPVVDKNGHKNQWIIGDEKFQKKYELDRTGEYTIFRPTGGVQIFVQITEDIIVQQWGEEMKIAKGGYINITNVNDMYAISKRDFDDTYRFVDGAPGQQVKKGNAKKLKK